MSLDRRRRLFEVLEGVLEQTPASRQSFLDELQESDPPLFRDVHALLELEAEADALFTQPAADVRPLVEGPELEPAELEPGARLGPYRVLELLGRGGMGSVYRAARQDDFEKPVAIKLLRGDLTTRSALRRFHAERQILARFEHPSIARLLDGGTTREGRPYLVMEYIEGLPIDVYCERHALPLRQRLELFRQVLAGVANAHQNLVVHRDLKPGNILVTPAGVPRLLDFGIAKLLDGEGDLTRTVAAHEKSPFTPRYASPEQIRGEPVTTASDVFSLGVLLYRLLTGRHPWVAGSTSARELERRICEEEPVPPSAAVADEARRARRALRGDLDAIVLKALRQDPRRRYARVEELAEDLRRHLEGLPVGARRGARSYRAGRFLRRHKGLAALAVLIVAFAIAATVLWRRAEGERRRADRERQLAVVAQQREERVSDFLQDLFRGAGPDRAQGRRLTAEDLLAAGRERLTAGLEDDPALAAELTGTLGDVYRNLGLYDDALELLERAVELRRELPPGHESELAVALNDLASALYYVGRYGDAARRFREVLELRRELGLDPELIAHAASNLASALKQLGRLAEAGELYREALAVREVLHGPDDLRVAASLYALGSLYHELGELDSAIAPLRRALAIRSARLGAHHTGVATVLGSLGRVLQARGELVGAEALLRRALDIRLELLGEDHNHVALSRRDLGAVLLERGRLDEAGQLITEALASLRASQASGDWTIAWTESLWGSWLAAAGRLQDAAPILERSHAALRATKGEASIYTRMAYARLIELR